jgi:hypothetical protein
MLPLDLIHNLDTIAFEGWEYHKLPLEEPRPLISNQGNWNLPPKAVSVASLKPMRDKPIRAEQNSVGLFA